MAFTKEVLDEILKDYHGPDDFYGPEGIMKQLTKALAGRTMEAELTEHLGYEKHDQNKKTTANRRNGKSVKELRTDGGPMEIEIPRDREGTFEPQIVPKHQREFRGFDDKILSMYAPGLTARQIQEHLKDIYAVEVSPELISRVTDEVKELAAEWRGRPLEPFYPVVFLDALRVNIRDGGAAVKKSVYLALAIRLDGQKELLGLRIEQNEGAKFWPGVMNELKNRGVQDILLAAVDGLAGFPEAVNAVFPRTEVQLCIVRMARNSVRFVPYKDRKSVVAGLKKIYLAPPAELALCALDGFAEVWDKKYPMIAKSWRSRRNEVIPFFKFSPEIRKAVYTTNAIEPVNYTIQKIIKHRQSFPNDEAAVKLIFMGLKKIAQKWTIPVRDWGAALNQFAVIYGEDRVPL
ncbi:MAG: IS256-like element ISSod18 family transposase [Treponemataceae bacterium]|nr:MAG: IS256-like element ISSod18 family transposase [Treponemataceae bacterium]